MEAVNPAKAPSRKAHGTPCWYDYGAPDQDRARTFYTSLFGWKAHESPIDEQSTYTMLQKDGRDAAALYQQEPDKKEAGVRPHWFTYIAVDDADAAAEAAVKLGGQLVAGPHDVFEAGRMAVLQDPTGAHFCVWQGRYHVGATAEPGPGSACWVELATKDAAAAEAFYTKLFGWEAETQEMSVGPYTSFKRGDQPVAGMMQMTEEWGEVPPHWMVYFEVADADAAVARVPELGGTVCVPATDIPEVGRFAVIDDPVGGTFSIIEMKQAG